MGKDIVGKGIANPLATLLSTSMMFRHLNLPDFSDRYPFMLALLLVSTVVGAFLECPTSFVHKKLTYFNQQDCRQYSNGQQ